MRRRTNEGTIHPVLCHGRLTSWRGLASYVDPETGTRHRKSVTRKTRKEAEAALRALIRELPKTPVNHRPRTAQAAALLPGALPGTVHALLEHWVEHKRGEVRPTTIRGYVHSLNLLLPLLGHLEAQALSVLDVEGAIRHLRDTRTSRTAARALLVLNLALRQAVRWQQLPANVAQTVRSPRVPKTEMNVWKPEQVQRFLDTARSHRLAPLFLLAIATGMRKGELLALQWEDLDLETGELTVQRNLVKDEAGRYVLGLPKTDAGTRRILLADDMVATLKAHRAAERRVGRTPRPQDFVFTASSGNHVQHRQLDKAFHRLTDSASLPRIRFHDLRHTAASLIIRQGVPAKVVADRLGHADVRFTLQVYTHVYDDQRAAAALPMSQLLGEMPSANAPADLKPNEMSLGNLRQVHEALGKLLAQSGR